MAELRAARVVYQVHSPATGGIGATELAQVVSRHPVPTGHVEVETFEGAEATRFARASLPAAGDFAPPLDFDAYAKLRQARVIWRIEVSEVAPEDLGYLRAALLIAGELAAMSGGIIVDTLAFVTLGAQDIVRELDRAFDPQRQVAIHVDRGQRPFFIHTHGMEKFGHPDFELHGVPRASVEVARRLLRHLIASVVSGGRFCEGESTQLCGFSFLFCRSECDGADHFGNGSLSLRSFRLVAGLATPEMEGMLTA
jgi:hypothetical protein